MVTTASWRLFITIMERLVAGVTDTGWRLHNSCHNKWSFLAAAVTNEITDTGTRLTRWITTSALWRRPNRSWRGKLFQPQKSCCAANVMETRHLVVVVYGGTRRRWTNYGTTRGHSCPERLKQSYNSNCVRFPLDVWERIYTFIGATRARRRSIS